VSTRRAIRRAIGFLDPNERKRWGALIPLAIVAALFEAAGAVLIFTLIAVIADPSAIETSKAASFFYREIAAGDRGRFVAIFAAAVAVFYVAKNGMILLETYAANRCASQSVASLSTKLLKAYLAAPYSFHFHRNSANLIRNTNNAVDATFRSVLVSAVHSACEIMLVIALLVVLVATAPWVTLITSVVMGVLVLVLLKLTQKTFALWGGRTHELAGSIIANLQQSLAGVKEVKILGRERYFYDSYREQRESLSRLLWLRATLENMPRLVIETVFVLGVVTVIVVFEARGSSEDIVPLLGLFAYAGFRIMPSVHRVIQHFNNIRFGAASVDEVHNDVNELKDAALPESSESSLPFEAAIRFEGVRYTYPRGEHPALDGVDLEIAKGTSIGIVGATGAGKSTLVDLLLGLLPPDAGRITVDGRDIQQDIRGWQNQLGYVPQMIYLIDDTLRRNVALGVPDDRIDEGKVRRAVQLAQLEDFVSTLSKGLDTLVGERGVRLSGGERQRVAIARALYREPDVLIFDEATSSLDNRTEQEMTRAIEGLRGDKTLIIIAHRLTTVRRCDRLLFLAFGKIIDSGSFEQLLANNEEFRRLSASS
jgi:ATP-binding cassette, subfamily B, bacterial PglK